VQPRRQSPPTAAPPLYDPRLTNSATDLEALAGRLVGLGPGTSPALSLCLYGPPGTGKSEYVRHLARLTDRPLLLRRCSDLLSMWVGATERRIAEAFREAREEGALLLLDEADSFLRDRRRAQHSWEVTHTNELLQQLEAFPGIVACTTNLVEELDQASLRRFVFKIRFDYLTPGQVQALFDATLGGAGDLDERTACHRRLASLARVTPGDFAAVRRRLGALGAPLSGDRLLRELEAELALKDGPARRAGF
jgi:SpoVK/Ycf46/Vps4 family AAA+-type ATPase